jgi:hypothetical protein
MATLRIGTTMTLDDARKALLAFPHAPAGGWSAALIGLRDDEPGVTRVRLVWSDSGFIVVSLVGRDRAEAYEADPRAHNAATVGWFKGRLWMSNGSDEGVPVDFAELERVQRLMPGSPRDLALILIDPGTELAVDVLSGLRDAPRAVNYVIWVLDPDK